LERKANIGPAMFDLAISETSQQIVREFYESSKVVAAVCHGPAALVNVKLSDGTYLIAGQGTTGLSNTEEKIAGAMAGMPFSLEDALKGIVAMLICSRLQLNPFGPKVVVSGKTGNLITGQNPASAGPIAEVMLKGIK